MNDYSAKAFPAEHHRLSAKTSSFLPEESILVGNVVLYGATTGEVFSTASQASVSPFATPAQSRSLKAWAINAANT